MDGILANTNDAIEEMLSRLRSADRVVIDAETSGLDWKVNHPIGWVITVGPGPRDTYYAPVRHSGGANIPGASTPDSETTWAGDVHPIETELAGIFRDGVPRKVIFHHAAFDLKFGGKVGIGFGKNLEDTMVNAAILDENQKKYSLEFCANAAGVKAKRGQELYEHLAGLFEGKPEARAQMGNLWKLPGDDEIAADYACGDGTSTWQLCDWQNVKISDAGLEKVHKIECRVIRTLHRMTSHGVPIDEEYLHLLKKQTEATIKIAMGNLPKGLNIRSNPQLVKLMTEKGRTDWPTTPKGNPSIVEEWLKNFDLGKDIVKVRKLTNLNNTFVGPMIDRHLYNGRVHTNFNQLKQDDYGVVSGRLSANDPNLQQVPKREEELAKMFRATFIAGEGMEWHTRDYSQQDYRIFAHYSQSDNLIDGYNADPPVDIHSAVAEMLDVERDPTAKRMNLGMLNGMGIAKLAASINSTPAQAKQHLTNYHTRFPEVREFIQNAATTAQRRGYVFTLLGRHIHYPNSRYAYKACSGIVQGSSADVTKLKMVEVDDYFESEGDNHKLILQVHDELDWLSPEGETKVNKEATRIMESFGSDDQISLRVPMPTDASHGANWAEATFGG